MKMMTKKILLYTGLVLTAGYLVWVVCLMKDKYDERACHSVEITVLDSLDRQFVQQKEIAMLLRNAGIHPLGKKYGEIDTQAMEECLEKQPYLKNVECHKTCEGTIKIAAEQRKPRFRVLGDENYYVDEEGEIMPVGVSTAYYVPIFTGRISRRMAQEELIAFVDFLEDNPFWDAQIKQIHVNDRQEVELVPTVGDHLILLGKWDGFERKLKKLKTFYKELSHIGWNDEWKEIDLRFTGQVICRK